jgi:hypothetical protein
MGNSTLTCIGRSMLMMELIGRNAEYGWYLGRTVDIISMFHLINSWCCLTRVTIKSVKHTTRFVISRRGDLGLN